MATTTGTGSDTDKGRKGSGNADTRELAAEIEALRNDLQSLGNTVTRLANKQIGRVQDVASEKAQEAEEAIRRNPLTAVAIAVGLGFLFGLITRR